jgi:hypothetical protein
MIAIISNQNCKLAVDVLGSYKLSLLSVSGMFNPIILDVGDWIQFEAFKFVFDTRIILTESNLLIEYLNQKYVEQSGTSSQDHVFEYDMFGMITHFPEPILNCSDRFKHIFNLKTFPAKESKQFLQLNGPMILLIKCTGIPTSMRLVNQTDLTKSWYASMKPDIVSLNMNQFSIGVPFTIVGNSYLVEGGELVDVKFSIMDVYHNEIEFASDLVWTFSLDKIEQTF